MGKIKNVLKRVLNFARSSNKHKKEVIKKYWARLTKRKKKKNGNIGNVKNILEYKQVNGVKISRGPLISVLLPIYNHADVAPASIESILNQTYTNFELVILDDGSTDNLIDVLKKYSYDYRIKFYNQPNQKLPRALSNLHSLARGEFITWTSADNIMEPNMLEVLSNNLITNPDAVLVYADVKVIDEKGENYFDKYRDIERDVYNPEIIRLLRNDKPLSFVCDNYINACFLYRKDAAKTIGNTYASDLVGLEDYDFWLRLKKLGRLLHVSNKAPLYNYRVHKNTMSHELLTKKLDEHSMRSKCMFEYEKSRQSWCNDRPYVLFSKSIKKDKFENILKSIACNTNLIDTQDIKLKKRIKIFSSEDKPDTNSEYFIFDGFTYKLFNKKEEILELEYGIDINPLAFQARSFNRKPIFVDDITNSGMKIVGCHSNLEYLEIEYFKNILSSNKDVLFVLIDVANNNEIANLKEKNLRYYPNVKYGEPVDIYTNFNNVFIPKVSKNQSQISLENLVLAWSTGRWINYPETESKISTFPFTIPYGDNYDFFVSENNVVIISEEDIAILDTLIDRYSTLGSFKYLIKVYNTYTQEIYIERPDFKIEVASIVYSPKEIVFEEKTYPELTKGWIGVMADTLDKGGLEQVIVFIVEGMVKRGLDIKILCSKSGGATADYLSSKGIEVHVFNGDEKKFDQFLKKNKPLLISTHFLNTMNKVLKDNKIVTIETIHNMYVFFNQKRWILEKERANDFTHMIAVSELVKEYFVKQLPKYEDKITVIGNSVNPKRSIGLTRDFIREILNISEDSTVFIELGSFDIRKNQTGLIEAFDEFYQKYNQKSYLLLIGNIADREYYKKILSNIKQLESKKNIIIFDFVKSIASYVNASDCMILPSYYEGWSISGTECLYIGTPLIHSKCGSAYELCSDNKGIIIENPMTNILDVTFDEFNSFAATDSPDNKDELVEAMKKIDSEIEVWKNRKIEIRNDSIKNYNIDKMIERYLEVFEKQISNKDEIK